MPDYWRALIAGNLISIAAILMAATSAIVYLGLDIFWLLGLLVSLAVLGFLARSKFLTVALLIACLVFYAYSAWRMPKVVGDDLALHKLRGQISLKGKVVELKQNKNSCRQMTLEIIEVVSQPLITCGKILVTYPKEIIQLRQGDIVQAKLYVRKTGNGKAFPRISYLNRRGIFSCGRIVKAEDITVRGSEASIWQRFIDITESCRKKLIAAHQQSLGDVEGSLLASMVIGNRAVSLPKDLTRAFRDVGLSHALAASGFNLTVVTGTIAWLANCFTKSTVINNLLCFSSMFAFVAMAGPSPSVMRAALMFCFFLWARLLARRADLYTAFSVALLFVLAIDPGTICDIGFQLSYMATAAIIYGVNPLAKLIGGKRFVIQKISEAIAVVVVAQASVVPIQLYYFRHIGLFFLPANLITSPFIYVSTLGGFASSVLFLLPGPQLLMALASLIDKGIAFPLGAILFTTKWFASFEQAKLTLGQPNIWSIVFYYVAGFCLLTSLKHRRYLLLSTLLYAISIAALIIWR